MLEKSGALVKNVPAYRTINAKIDPQTLAELDQGIDVLTLTSASTARSFSEAASSDKLIPAGSWLSASQTSNALSTEVTFAAPAGSTPDAC